MATAVFGSPCAGREQRRHRFRHGLLLLGVLSLALAVPVRGAPGAPARLPAPHSTDQGHAAIARDGPFDSSTVVELARALAKAPFVPAPASLPEALAKLDYDQYRDIRFRPSATIWAQPSHTFRLQVLPLGYLFTTPVEIALVRNGQAQHLAYRADLFIAGEL